MNRPSVTGSGLRRWRTPGPLILLLLIAAFFVSAVPESGETIGSLGMVIGFIAAGSLTIRRSRALDPRERAAWAFFGSALLVAALGVLVVGGLTEMGVVLPAFGVTDTFFIAGYVMLIISLYRLARSDGDGRSWLPTILDALVGAIALFALVWSGFFHELFATLEGAPSWELAIASSYPILDMAALIGLIILAIRRSHFRMDVRIIFLAVGFGAQVVADFSYLSSGVGKTFAEAEPKFVLFLVTAACYLVTAALIDRPPLKREFPEDEAPLWAFVWPYLLAAALLATHVGRYRSLNPGEAELLMLDAMVIIGIVVFLRQVLMIHRNRVRVEKQRTELVASVSHELRTPLTAMVGYLALLDDHGDEFPEDARREMISEATGQSKHMARLVSDLVMLARGDHRHLPLEIDEVSLSSIMTAALRGVDPESTKIEEELIRDANVRVDADRLQQALANMLSNAVRYGGDRALVSARVEGEDLIIEVHDNGDGVPTRYEAAIWQRFERGAHRLNAMTPGLGIGLAIVSAVAVSHGGKASYRTSERLGGACFSLVIPGCLVRRSEASRMVEVSS